MINEDVVTRNILHNLEKNRKILKKVFKKLSKSTNFDHVSLRKDELRALGFHLSFYTHMLRRQQTKFYFCFDYAFHFEGPYAHVMRVDVTAFRKQVA